MRTKLKYGVMYKERYNESGKLVKYIPENGRGFDLTVTKADSKEEAEEAITNVSDYIESNCPGVSCDIFGQDDDFDFLSIVIHDLDDKEAVKEAYKEWKKGYSL